MIKEDFPLDKVVYCSKSKMNNVSEETINIIKKGLICRR